MSDFNIVSNDIIDAINNIKYDDFDKRFIQTQILYNIYNLFFNYIRSISFHLKYSFSIIIFQYQKYFIYFLFFNHCYKLFLTTNKYFPFISFLTHITFISIIIQTHRIVLNGIFTKQNTIYLSFT